jgi:mRNA interferase YafQ
VRTFSRTNQFKRDVKLAGKRGKNLEKLREVLDLLIGGNELPPRHRDHPLRGDYLGSRDCHIEPDWIRIYTLDGNHVRFERTGTHSDLFR